MISWLHPIRNIKFRFTAYFDFNVEILAKARSAVHSLWLTLQLDILLRTTPFYQHNVVRHSKIKKVLLLAEAKKS